MLGWVAFVAVTANGSRAALGQERHTSKLNTVLHCGRSARITLRCGLTIEKKRCSLV